MTVANLLRLFPWPARKAPLPDTVYKFYGPTRTEVFDNFQVRFSQLAALNDPFEFLVSAQPGDLRKGAARIAGRRTNLLSLIGIGIWAAVKAARENEKLGSLPWPLRMLVLAIAMPVAVGLVLLLSPFIIRQMRAIMLAAADEMEEILFKRVREGLVLIFSCTETWRSVPMWAHYAANHTGFALGINPAGAFVSKSKKSENPFVHPRKVRYLSRAPRVSPNLDINDFICSKMKHWSYEREWRFIGLSDEADARGAFVDGQELLLFQIQSESITEVVFGANCSRSTVVRILDLLMAAGVAPKIYQVRQTAGYGFERVRIEQVTDLNLEPVRSGPAPNLGDETFQHLQNAFAGFVADAERGRFTRWLYRQNERLADVTAPPTDDLSPKGDGRSAG